ncbi:BPSS1780 family membrane protein [Pigmentiphaga soli]|uniref:BPSS1780 family membrane protein n=1 Tax=Pigmentiphaga soli TaxID=1007095 RepID=A0ABP8GYW5_9BURK
MQASSLPPNAGIRWVREGWALFRRQPVAMFTWALTIGFMVLVASQLQPVGPLLFVVLMPSITVMTLQACRDIVAGKPVYPLQLFAVLKRPGLARRLLAMGGAYVALVLAVGMLAFLPFADTLRDTLEQISDNDLAPLLVAMRFPIAIFGLLYVAIAALFWHAPALVAWQGLGLRKALFFSGVACWRNKGAFVVYGLAWFVIVSALEIAGGLLVEAGLSENLAGLIQMPFNFLAAAALYCSFYPVYVSIFGQDAFERPAMALPERH